jgi:hypothetical protein
MEQKEAPSSKHQAPDNHQGPNTKVLSVDSLRVENWSLKVGSSLELGAWSLVL